MILTVKHLIEQYHMLQKGDSVVIGVSGGADSVCLLHILWKLQAEYCLRLLAVHIHHGIRGKEADEDAAFTEELCRERNVEYRLIKKNVPKLASEQGISEEEAGRLVRYETFYQICEQEGYRKIAVAHHQNDNAETIMWNFLRGSGLRGLAGMEPVRGMLIRPLLEVKRSQIEQWMQQEKIPWRNDSTNETVDYTRNKLRHQLLPWIEQNLVAGFCQRITNNTRIFYDTDEYLKNEAQKWMQEYAFHQQNESSFPRKKWDELHPALKRYVIRSEIDGLTGSLKDLTAEHVEAVLRLKGTGKQLDLPAGMKVWIDYEAIHIGKKQKMDIFYPNLEMNYCCFPYEKGQKIIQNVYTKWFDYDKIKVGFQLRTRKTGDRIQVLSEHGSKKLKDYMIDAKIPREIRDHIPLVADGADVMWVVGYRINEAYKITDETKTVLQIQLNVSNQ